MPSMEEIKIRAVPWGVLFLRLMFSFYLLVNSVYRMMPSLIEDGLKNSDKAVKGFFGVDSTGFVIVGVCEFFFGFLVFLGLYVRLALVPILMFSVLMMFKQIKVEKVFISPVTSAAEEYFLVSVITIAFIIIGSGRLSLQTKFAKAGGAE